MYITVDSGLTITLFSFLTDGKIDRWPVTWRCKTRQKTARFLWGRWYQQLWQRCGRVRQLPSSSLSSSHSPCHPHGVPFLLCDLESWEGPGFPSTATEPSRSPLCDWIAMRRYCVRDTRYSGFQWHRRACFCGWAEALPMADSRTDMPPICCRKGSSSAMSNKQRFYRAMHYSAKRGLAIDAVCPSDSLSVCLWRWWIMTT